MNKTLTNILVITGVLGITGALRLSFEQKLADDMKEAKLVPPRFDMETRAKLKQKGFAAAFGSLRPAMASFVSINAIEHFKDKEWNQLEEDFTEATLLDPRNVYYWDTGSWHLATNASSDMYNKKGLSFLEREKGFREYIQRGKDFLDRGIRTNPDNWKIHLLKGKLEANSYRLPDYKASVKTFDHILSMKGIPESDRLDVEQERLNSLIKIPSMHQEAYDAALKLYQAGEKQHFPLVLTAIIVGQNHPLNKVTYPISLRRLYKEDGKRAYKDLITYWKNKDDLEQDHGIKNSILSLESHLKVPANQRFFRKK